jgi:ABC transport system ATP-binding/permease protein
MDIGAHTAHAAELLDRQLHLLGRIGLFQVLSPLLLGEIAALLRPVAAAPGEVIVRQGAAGDALYLIEAGTVRVEAEVPGAAPHVLARLGPLEFFGEMALVTGEPRSATVRAEDHVRLWAIRADELHVLVARRPALADAIREAAELRRHSNATQEYGLEATNLAELLNARSEVRLGRAADNDLVLDSRVVSAYHAVVRRSGGAIELVDLGSANGTFVNGARMDRATLKDGDQLWLADQRLLFDTRIVQRVREPRGIRVEAVALRREVRGGKVILHEVDLQILPGELVAIVGGSGAGKSTLMDALSGVRPATRGEVLYNGQPLSSHRSLYRTTLGYVPQDDIIHTDLPLRRTLDFSAKLRLPRDTSAAERRSAVDQALEELSLTAQADVRVASLSGGQRKRASIGVELLTRPRIFFLDEPTSGLDPATDLQMMRLLRDLASAGSTVVLTTHATKNVALCDKIAFLAKGGHLAFFGTPARALQYFGVTEFDEIYVRLAEESTPEEWAARFRASPEHARMLADRPSTAVEGPIPSEQARSALARPARGPRSWLRQLAVLSARNATLYLRNPARLGPLFAQPVIFGLLLVLLFRSDLYAPGTDSPTGAFQLLFIFSLSAFLFGLLFGVQEVVKEFAIVRRERLANLSAMPYLLSKIAFLAPLLVVAVSIIMVMLWATGRLPDGGWSLYGQLLLTYALTAWCGLAVALFTSCVARTPQMATDLLSLWIMPQVLFSGAIIPVEQMTRAGEVVSHGIVLRWSLDAVGRVADLLGLFESSPSPVAQSLSLQYAEAFGGEPTQAWIILAAMTVGFTVVAWAVLASRTRS